MEAALQALHQGNIGIKFLQELKLIEGIHTRYSAGYKVWAAEADIRHRGEITLVWREETGWQVESVTVFGLNMVSFTITAGQKRWYVVGAYVTPND